jgi:ParB/RepB/Spo0J family partition protein
MSTEVKNEVVDVKATKNKDIMLVDPRNIIFNPDNVRTDMGDLEELMTSIVEIGLQVSLKAKKVRGEDKYLLVDGHRRMKAILLALEKGYDIPFVEVMPYTGNNEDILFTMIVTGSGQKPLTDIEMAEAIKRLVSFHYKAEEIAKKIGKSVPQVYNYLTLANVPKEVKNLVHDGLISGSTVVKITRVADNDEDVVGMVKEAISDASKVSDGKDKPKKATDKNVAKLKANTPVQKINQLIVELEMREDKSEQVVFMIEFLSAVKTESVETLLGRVK